jgi:hypothetical protein
METSHRETTKETEYSMLYDEIILFLTLGSIKTVYFADFQSLLQHEIFRGSATTLHRVLTTQKRII